MSEVVKLDEAIAEVQKRFEALQVSEREMSEKRSALDKSISDNKIEQLRLQGEYRALLNLKGKPEGPKEEQVN